MILRTRVLQANGSHRIMDRSLECRDTPKINSFIHHRGTALFINSKHPFISYPRTCSCPFFTPSRKPCSSLARLPSTNFSRMQASKHQVNCHSTQHRHKGENMLTQSLNTQKIQWCNGVTKLIPHHCLCPYLMAGVYRADLTDVQVVQRHQQLCSQCAVVDVSCSQEECS